MRETNITQTIREDIRSIEDYPGQMIRVGIGQVGENGEFLVPQTYTYYSIIDGDLRELLSPAPVWAPNKPSGVYRKEDLWIFIDRQRSK